MGSNKEKSGSNPKNLENLESTFKDVKELNDKTLSYVLLAIGMHPLNPPEWAIKFCREFYNNYIALNDISKVFTYFKRQDILSSTDCILDFIGSIYYFKKLYVIKKI
jgi:hypothetical protein